MNNEKQSSSSAFVQYVINRCSNEKDTGFRAVMRRADNPNQCSAAWEYLVPFCDLASAHQRLSFALIGAAIAREKPEHDGTNGVGEALLKLCNGDKDAKKREGTRLRRLIACDTIQELIPVLQRTLQYIQSKGETLCYERLLRELLFWNQRERKRTCIEWTKQFYEKDSNGEE